MAAELILTLEARDRPGLVGRVANVVARHDGNWVESSLARLGDHFVGLVHVTAPAGAVAPLSTDLAALADEGITVRCRDRQPASDVASGSRIAIAFTGVDHPGIVRDVSAALHRMGVSIEELYTHTTPGSMSGSPMFAANGTATCPPDVDLSTIEAALEAIAGDLMVEIGPTA